MKFFNHALLLVLLAALFSGSLASAGEAKMNTLTEAEKEAGWKLLFNGQDLSGWKAVEHPSTFKVEDGELIVKGKRAHLFYTGMVNDAEFDDFHFKAEVLTKPHANSGIYFHTKYQEKGWPKHGYEAQINNTHSDKKKTGGLYDAANNFDKVAEDNEWFLYEIIVNGKKVTVKIDGKAVTEYIEPSDVHYKGWPGRKLSKGTFAIQGHDPKSEVHFRNIKVKPLD